MSFRYSQFFLAGVVVVAGACSKAPPPKRPPTPVSVTTVHKTTMPYVITSNGVVEPLQTVSIESQVSGILQRVAFAEGQDVHVGEVLFQIDSRPYVATLNQARAQLARDEAQAANARREASRYDALVQQGYVTQSQTDQARSTAASAAATVEADRANVAKAQVDVSNCTIRAPITGRTGSLLVRQGNVVKSGGDPLVVINQIQPILVRFTVPQSQVSRHSTLFRGQQDARGKRHSIRKDRAAHTTARYIRSTTTSMSNSGTVLLRGKVRKCRGYALAGPVCEDRPSAVRGCKCVDCTVGGSDDEPAGDLCVHC